MNDEQSYQRALSGEYGSFAKYAALHVPPDKWNDFERVCAEVFNKDNLKELHWATENGGALRIG